jgi:quinol monooxygenase YgiN
MSTPRIAGQTRMVTMGMVIVAGHLLVDPEGREGYLEGCREVVEQARRADGCLDYALSADVLDPGRINVFERWESLEAVEAFRGDGVQEEQGSAIIAASIAEYGAVEERLLS